MENITQNVIEVELVSLAANVGLGFATTCVLCLATVDFVLMGRTKKVPSPAKIISRSLLLLIMVMLVSTTIRRFVRSPALNVQLAVLIQCTRHLTLVTVVIISVERYLCICRPMFYSRLNLSRRLKHVTIASWSCVSAVFFILRFGICSAVYNTTKVFTNPWVCKEKVTFFYILLYVSSTIVSTICFVKIYRVLGSLRKTQQQVLHSASIIRSIRDYKATVFVFLNLLLYLIRAISNGILLYFMNDVLSIAEHRMYADIQWLVFSISFCFIYVFWFKESRFELLKLIARFSGRKFDRHIERIRIEVFDIVVSTSVASKTLPPHEPPSSTSDLPENNQPHQ